MKKLLFIIGLLLININFVLADDTFRIWKENYGSIFSVYMGTDRPHLFYGDVYRLDSKFAYCIEPGIKMTELDYYRSDDFKMSGIPEDKIDKVKLIAYYGFDYGTHKGSVWYYFAAQELIWREITGRDVYFVSEEDVNGPRINIEQYKNEILSLVNSHNMLPSFNNKTYDVKAGLELVIDDENEALDDYQVISSTIDDVKIADGKIIIKASNNDTSGVIELAKEGYTNDKIFFYYNGNSQKLMSATGSVPPVKAKLNINLAKQYGLKIVKRDKISGGIIKLAGIKFEIKNVDTDEPVCENDLCIFETDDNGIIRTDQIFMNGRYMIRELEQDILGYYVNEEPIMITIDEDVSSEFNLDGEDIIVDFFNEPIRKQIKLLKVGEEVSNDDGLIYLEKPIDHTVFNLYAGEDIIDLTGKKLYSKNSFIASYQTQDGELITQDLPFGTYYFKEILTDRMYDLLVDPVVVKIDNQSEMITVIKVKNYLKKGEVIFTKYDDDGNVLAGALLGIYQGDSLIYQAYTDDNGVFKVDLPYGEYVLKEINPPSGFMLNIEEIPFIVDDNNRKLCLNMENKRIAIPNTGL